MRRLLTFAALLLPLTGCGYHVAGAAVHLPADVRTLSVPVFATRAQNFHTEFAFTQSVIRELNTRTRYRVVDGEAPADATLSGTILSETAAPLTYDSSSGQTSSYLITITAQVVLTARDGHVLYRNNALSYRDQYQSTQDIGGFLQEDSPAVQRIARDFAQSVVSNLLESF